uniref:3-beta hydroxysteroid dehydrogenase/isomerase domain-containing protein n=1 Tax=Ditylenchus dipsaci TaxID=166011 RepID=A0A915E846_9BILA
MERIAVLGANSLIGQHLLCAIASVDNNNKTMVVWEMTDPFFNRLADNNNMKSLNVNSFVGLNSLDDALQGCDIVFNLHEVQDFSLMPNEQLLKQHNVEFVENLVEKCFTSGVSKLIHLSSVYLQCSARWPNVKNRECEDYDKFRSEVPFPAYCDSKYKAEQLIQSKVGQIQSISARVGPVYGEGDCCSLICDSILLSERIYQLPRIGDQNGVLQFVYAGNVAYALLKCADKLFEDDAVRNEIPLYDESNRSINNRASAVSEMGLFLSTSSSLFIACSACLVGCRQVGHENADLRVSLSVLSLLGLPSLDVLQRLQAARFLQLVAGIRLRN